MHLAAVRFEHDEDIYDLMDILKLEFAPFVKGINLVRQVMTSGLNLGQIALTDWLSLSLNAVVYFVLGVLIFKWCEQIAMRRGFLGQY